MTQRFAKIRSRPALSRVVRGVLCWAALTTIFVAASSPLVAQSGRFDDFEIRVFQERYFAKTGRFELGAQFTAIMNQTFIYTYMATGILTYHINEQFGVEGSASYGFSIDKDDKRSLDDTFDIQTQIIRTKYMLGGSVVWTPMYGKNLLSSGKLLYFDTFLSAGLAMNGVEYLYDHCRDPNEIADATVRQGVLNRDGPKPAPRTVPYMGGQIGVGQRLFLNREMGLRWDVRNYFFPYDEKDGACGQSAVSKSSLHNNVMLQLGATKFF